MLQIQTNSIDDNDGVLSAIVNGTAFVIDIGI